MLEEIILPKHWQLELEDCLLEEEYVILSLRSTSQGATCSLCSAPSTKKHSFYFRHLADLPLAGQFVKIVWKVRRFFCPNLKCQRKTFAEQIPQLVQPMARRTQRQSQLLQAQAFVLGGEEGARQAATLGIKVSPSTLLRLLRKVPLPSYQTPRLLGVDDFAFRKGIRYGTILVDLEKHCPIDLLPDRTAETLAEWLKAHQGVEMVSRDRASAYADGIRQGAPFAPQVADRFHLIKNLGDRLKTMFERKNAALLKPLAKAQLQIQNEPPLVQELQTSQLQEESEAHLVKARVVEAEDLAQIGGAGTLAPAGEAEAVEETDGEIHEDEEEPKSRKEYLFRHVKGLNRAGLSHRTIARELGISRVTVQKYLARSTPPTYTPRPKRPSKLDLYKPYIEARWREGVCKGIELYLEIKGRGYDGSWSLLNLFLVKYRREHPPVRKGKVVGRPVGSGKKASQRQLAPEAKPQPMLSAREAVWIMLKKEEDLSEKQHEFLRHLRQFDEEIEAAYQLSQQFLRMARQRQGGKLEEWLVAVEEKVKNEQLAELGSFARGIRQDQAAVKAGLTLEISQGQVEGQVNRLKLIKRMMFGRGKFELLKARVLHRSPQNACFT